MSVSDALYLHDTTALKETIRALEARIRALEEELASRKAAFASQTNALEAVENRVLELKRAAGRERDGGRPPAQNGGSDAMPLGQEAGSKSHSETPRRVPNAAAKSAARKPRSTSFSAARRWLSAREAWDLFELHGKLDHPPRHGPGKIWISREPGFILLGWIPQELNAYVVAVGRPRS